MLSLYACRTGKGTLSKGLLILQHLVQKLVGTLVVACLYLPIEQGEHLADVLPVLCVHRIGQTTGGGIPGDGGGGESVGENLERCALVQLHDE